MTQPHSSLRELRKRADMTEARHTPPELCTYPGCTRPRRPDPATGRPSRYCEQADDGGGPVHQAAEADRQTVTELRQELERQRDETRAERDALRADHAAQLARIERSSNERVQALSEALAAAKEISPFQDRPTATTSAKRAAKAATRRKDSGGRAQGPNP